MSLSTVALMSLAEIIGDFGFKGFARAGGAAAFTQGSVGYIIVIYLLIKSLKTGNVLYVNGMWDGVSAIAESAAAYLILGERLNRPIEYFGLFIIIVGIFLLHAPKGQIPY